MIFFNVHLDPLSHLQVLSLTTHPFGCQVIQRVLERCLKEQTKPITDDLINHVYQLILDEYGNYIIKLILIHGTLEDKSRIVSKG